MAHDQHHDNVISDRAHCNDLSVSNNKKTDCSVAHIYVRLDLVLHDVASTVKGAAVALQCLTDDSHFITESSNRKTIFKDMFVSGEAFTTLN